ncbi:NAD(P)/FAD-dependent oxidoreductase [Cyanobium sp. Lug-B]|uniref:NAD(P)/FAD-dependent oxidoreductase n=1 Tax=Cyanobium sp. Lug-B TaxID=2823716 RepID=UPI0020CCECE7|nr:FAD-dependent oxidoreductase [Cyanobium sp. Lug-B]MCP9797654.1 FAD-dependent oxidoreductase [Cyanobium sp. Lug-B]
MLRLSELKLPLDHSADDLEAAITRRLRLAPGELRSHHLVKRSVDARKRGAIALVYCLDLELEAGARRRLLRRFAGDPHLRPTPDSRYRPVARAEGAAAELRPVVVGAGPCGYFAALLLAQMGWRPLLLERGKAVKERTADTFGFWQGRRRFDPGSNAQFGEGGAGTFSDGKLYSQVSENPAYIRKVLEELVAAGADPEILTLHHPHIGTFKLATVVRGLRARIEALGGEVRFGQHVVELLLGDGPQRRLAGVRLADGTAIACDHLVLAPGHSARDTFAMLHRLGVAMEPKPFAVGVRIEHPQALVDRARWGEAAGHPRLGPAEYKLVHHGNGEGGAGAGRSVYSFCMCPGGLVVGATSEEGCVVTNGMSQHSRRERNANSGLVVPISQEDLAPYAEEGAEALAGIAFQRHWERQAFDAGGGDYRAPAQWLEDFLEHRPSREPPPEAVVGSYQPGLRFGSLDDCLPAYVLDAIREALPAFARRIPGYAMAGALLTGVETRTSSPLRLLRHPTGLESLSTPGLFPAGEGAGHAGGILSAAIDGIKVAEAVALSLGTPHRSTAPP